MKQVKYFCDFCGEETDDFTCYAVSKPYSNIISERKRGSAYVELDSDRHLCAQCQDVISGNAVAAATEYSHLNWEEL